MTAVDVSLAIDGRERGPGGQLRGIRIGDKKVTRSSVYDPSLFSVLVPCCDSAYLDVLVLDGLRHCARRLRRLDARADA